MPSIHLSPLYLFITLRQLYLGWLAHEEALTGGQGDALATLLPSSMYIFIPLRQLIYLGLLAMKGP